MRAGPGTHAELVERAARWAQRQGFGVVATEVVAVGCIEQADVVAFRSTCSVMLEVKISRSDFLADRAKPHRQTGGLGLYRFFVCPEGLIASSELPERWGLLYSGPRSIRAVVRPRGNLWPSRGVYAVDWEPFKHDPDPAAERRVLYSIARRLTGSGPSQIVRGRRQKN